MTTSRFSDQKLIEAITNKNPANICTMPRGTRYGPGVCSLQPALRNTVGARYRRMPTVSRITPTPTAIRLHERTAEVSAVASDVEGANAYRPATPRMRHAAPSTVIGSAYAGTRLRQSWIRNGRVERRKV